MKTIAEQLNVTEFPFRIKDSNGNEIYFENSKGYWSKKEYDTNGNLIYFENSSGYWRRAEYDANGNLIYFENSNGFYFKSEYDANGNQIYYKSSRGEIEDKRSKPCEDMVVEINGAKYLLTKI
jgi:YD repeat-containing protein